MPYLSPSIAVWLILDVYCQYEKVVLVDDFNAQIGEKCFDRFLFEHELKSMNGKLTCCYKNPDKLLALVLFWEIAN